MSSDRKPTLDAKQVQAFKAWTFFGLLASMGQMAAAAARTVVTRRGTRYSGSRKYSAAYYASAPQRPRPHSEPRQRYKSCAHQEAVALMRMARRLKRIAKADHLLAEKRRRQALQLMRHAHRLARQAKASRYEFHDSVFQFGSDPTRHHAVPAPHFLRHPD